MRVKKQQSWNRLTKLYNIQPGITRRTMLQLKTAWLNSRRIASRSGPNSTRDSDDTNDTELKEKDTDFSDKQDLVNIIITEPSEFKGDAKRIKHEALSDNEDDGKQLCYFLLGEMFTYSKFLLSILKISAAGNLFPVIMLSH